MSDTKWGSQLIFLFFYIYIVIGTVNPPSNTSSGFDTPKDDPRQYGRFSGLSSKESSLQFDGYDSVSSTRRLQKPLHSSLILDLRFLPYFENGSRDVRHTGHRTITHY